MTTRILLAEDDLKQARIVQLYLQRQGHQVIAVHDGQSALDRFRAERPDLVVLDVRLPRVNGLDVCRVLRAESGVPIIMVTANNTEDDLLLGLDVGADDYITKPFSPRELVARVGAALRRARRVPDDDLRTITVGDLEIDSIRFEVRVDGAVIELTAREFAILRLLARAPGRVFSRAEIVEQAFKADHEVMGRTVDAHVMKLRRKIDNAVRRPVQVETVYGHGYRLAVPA